jgi:hypothetical protein
MDEYIERKAIRDALYDADAITMSGVKILNQFPVADVAPVRHGRWIDGDPYCPICRKDKFIGLDADVWSDWQPDYCPNCGAKMDG